jgi:hypothetical protein
MNEIVFDEPSKILFLLGVLIVELFILYKLGDRVTGHLYHLAQRSRLSKALIYTLMAPGVTMHETAHAAASLGVGVSVKKFVPFYPREDKDGSVCFGYVQPGPATSVQGAVISLAPLWFTPLFIYISGIFILPDIQSYSLWEPWAASFRNLSSPWVWCWGFIFLSSSLSNFPSSVDFQAMRSLIPAVILLTLAPFVGALAGNDLSANILQLWLIGILLLVPSSLCCLLLENLLRK